MSNSQGDAGASARREYERRKARDEEKLRAQWGRLGGLAVALSSERRSTQVWEKGAVGEEKLGARLDSVASPTLKVLHDRRIRRTKANVDHLVITDSGVWVIDAKRYTGRPTLRVEGGLLRPRTETLLVGRRQCNKIVDGVIRQVDLVRAVVGDVPVHGVLCFIDADWPLFGGSFSTRDVHVVWPKRLVKLLTTTSPHQGMNVTDTHAAIANAFPPA
ncbi:nuclease-related domain-containing protein [Jonesia quinghaiensis]|uniref:nuclease-related domain-containing protein n=1 Tax=Jonesia quinghaiensis TaxID=262806 RepID=UPI0003FFA6E9|nr:nuclease-related domain-containing protein [Jonesia quinghaiensis]